MKKLPKYTLSYDQKAKNWTLKKDKTKKVVVRFKTKAKATKKGALGKAVGKDGGSVRIEKRYNSGYEEERTYPRSRDPRRSKG